MKIDIGTILDERMKEIAREVLQELIQVRDGCASRSDQTTLHEQLTMIKAKEHITTKEAALLLSCSESHIRKLLMLARKGKSHHPIPYVDLEGVTVFPLEALLNWARPIPSLQVVKNEAA